VAEGPWTGTVTLLEDPEVDGYGATRVVARAGDHHVEVVARGSAAGALRQRLSGQRIRVGGRIEPLGRSAAWLRHRHVAARLSLDRVGEWKPGSPVARAANGYRRRLALGAGAGLGRRDGSLLMGLTVGDDRDQPAGLTDAFRASGLTHLLAVSGQNVAFVLAVAGPLLARLGGRSRLVTALGVLAFFAVVTRLEPSVLRATVMAGGAVLTRVWGREASAPRLQGVAVVAVVLVDPLLVRSLAFQLSVAATWGIVRFSGPLTARIPGPAWVREPIAVTVAAQVAVAPIQIWSFDGLPLASLPANLLAGPAAGPSMVWGMTTGFVAGFVGDTAATVLLWPAKLLVGWIAVVAERSADLPLGSLGRAHLIAAAPIAALWWAAPRLGPMGAPWLRRVVAVVVAGVLVHAAVAGGLPRAEPLADIWRLETGAEPMVVVQLPSSGSPERLLEDLRRAEVSRIDVVLAHRGNRSQGRMVAALHDRHAITLVLAPAHHQVVTGRTPPVGMVVTTGGVGIQVEEVDPELVVTVTGRPSG
jgi:competence protein ComEC